MVNLLGEPVAQRWSEAAKRRIRESRVRSTRMLVGALTALPPDGRPRTLVSQSATGYYGPRGDAPVDEQAAAGDDFLAEVTVAWEGEAASAGSAMRVVCTRTGVVLSPSGGALAKMLPFFKLGIGGPVAGGRQYVLDPVSTTSSAGSCAASTTSRRPGRSISPRPVITNAELSRALGHALGRPAVLPVPGVAVKLLYGEMAEIVTTGQRAIPVRLGATGYTFRHPELGPALEDVLTGR